MSELHETRTLETVKIPFSNKLYADQYDRSHFKEFEWTHVQKIAKKWTFVGHRYVAAEAPNTNFIDRSDAALESRAKGTSAKVGSRYINID
jgi:hypothetical protein